MDQNIAVKCHQKASEQGLAAAQFKLGNLYSIGNGVPKDVDISFKLYQMSAGNGHFAGLALR
jgi:TPR repeat protein